ncbi:WD40-repeat-containing domain protein, partial [Mycena capillaripes]
SLEGREASVCSVAFSRDNKYVVSGSEDTTVRVRDIMSGNVYQKFEGHTEEVRLMSSPPEGRYIMSSSYDKTVHVWD